MATDGSWRQEEAFRDLAVRQTFGGELSDLQLLRGQAITKIRRTPPNPLPRGAQILPSSPAPRAGAQRIEQSDGVPERRPCFVGAPAPAQPATEREQGPGSKKRIAVQVLGERRGE